MRVRRALRYGSAALACAAAGLGAAAGVAASTPRCLTAELSVTPGASEGALGHVGVVVHFRNVSRSTCELFGYPGLQMLGAHGHALETHVIRGTAYTVPSIPERTVILAPGGEASFDLGYSDGTGYANASCPTSSRVEITPPNAYRSIVIAWRIQPYGGSSISRLQCGQITVSPVFAGAGDGV